MKLEELTPREQEIYEQGKKDGWKERNRYYRRLSYYKSGKWKGRQNKPLPSPK